MKRLFILLGILLSFTTAFCQNITKAEYFIDADPGQGKATPVTNFSSSDSVNFAFSVATATLGDGFHFLAIRVLDAEGKWSRYECRGFYLSSTTGINTANVVAAESFVDIDPGPGKATPAAIGVSGSTVIFTVVTPPQLVPGFHFLSIRVKDADGKWGWFEQRGFYVIPNAVNTPPIVAAEYFYDTDPGFGNASSLAVTTPSDTIRQTFSVPVPNSLSQGKHVLAIRVKDQQGAWSLYKQDTINVTNDITLSCPGNVSVTALAGQCSAVVNSIDPTVPANASYMYTLTGATTGSGNGTASGHTFNAGVTTVTYAISNSPTTNCSFTVTVIANVAPSVSITASQTSICPASRVTFTATQANGGNSPSYQWKLNGNTIPGAINSTYQTTSLQDGDVISVVMSSSIACANPSSATSNTITMAVHPFITPSVSITATANSICPGQTVLFTATPVNGGTQPVYEWVKNGVFVASGNLYQTSELANNDSIYVQMHNTTDCVTDTPVKSNVIHITVAQFVTPSVTMSVSPSESLCAGTLAVFTASPVNGAGSSPGFQWKRNGVNVPGANNSTFQTSTLQNGDVIRVEMTSSLGCANPQTVLSHDSITMAIGSVVLVPSVTVSSSTTAICQGQTVQFAAIPTNGGSVPAYQWQLNGNDIPGATDSSFETSSLKNGDKIKLVMWSSLPCTSSSHVTSNEIIMTVNSGGPASVIITASQTTICTGQSVTFTATPTNGGTAPAYEWTLNGSVVGSNIPTYQTASLKNGDVVKLAMQPYGSCAGNAAVYSNSITMSVSTAVMPSVTITASAIDICSGQQVTFNANAVNGGSTPSYQWKVNGANVGGDSAVFHTSVLKNADTVKLVMSSSLSCANPKTVTSNSISMDVSPAILPSVTINASATSICSGSQLVCTATAVNGGDPTYEWRLNGNRVGGNSNTWQTSTLANGDSIVVYLTSSLPCANPKTVKSNVIAVTVNNLQTYYRDLDGDGYGSSVSGTMQACSAPVGYVSNNNDCIDNNAAIHPGGTDVCGNSIDDNCNGVIDETCTINHQPVLMVRTYPVKEGDVGETVLYALVTLDTITRVSASVHYTTADENAKAGQDYVAASGVLTIPAGSSSATIQLRIIGDVVNEGNERFDIRFSQPVGMIFNGDSISRVMILDDDRNIKKPQDLIVPNLVKRNQLWQIPGIDTFQNEIFIMDGNGQVIKRFVNYHNQSSLGNIATGFYFYRIQTKQGGELKTYTGRILLTD